MFLSFDLQQFIFFEFTVDIPHFDFFLNPFSLELLVFCYDTFVLPGSPNFVLDFLFLSRSLFNCAYDDAFSPSDLNHLISLLLLHYHFSASFFTLMPSLFSLSSRNTSLFSWFIPNHLMRICSLQNFP